MSREQDEFQKLLKKTYDPKPSAQERKELEKAKKEEDVRNQLSIIVRKVDSNPNLDQKGISKLFNQIEPVDETALPQEVLIEPISEGERDLEVSNEGFGDPILPDPNQVVPISVLQGAKGRHTGRNHKDGEGL